jgi:hypothetical protein
MIFQRCFSHHIAKAIVELWSKAIVASVPKISLHHSCTNVGTKVVEAQECPGRRKVVCEAKIAGGQA